MSLSGAIVNPKQAIQQAQSALREMVTDAKSIRLEEITMSDDDRRWRVTLSFLADSIKDDLNALEQLLELKPTKRRARVIEIDASTGRFKGMKLVHV
ncbi:MAG: hypothetical protein WD690_07655 [Vicinamibacterales bacterium]